MTAGANLVIGLDVGTTAVRTVVAELDRETRSLRVIGLGHAAARGLRKGLVTNLDGAVESIRTRPPRRCPPPDRKSVV